METPAKQTPTASSEIVMLVRKLRWAGLEEKAEQLEKELEQTRWRPEPIQLLQEANMRVIVMAMRIALVTVCNR